jgi:hypothetical protein
MMARTSGTSSGRGGRSGRSAPSGLVGFWTRPERNRYLLMVGFLVRRRAELTVLTVGIIVFTTIRGWFTPQPTPGQPAPEPIISPTGWALIVMAATLAVVMAVPPTRRVVWGRCRAVLIRHRMRACFVQTRTWTTNGRLPFLMWSRPSHVGERVRVWLPAGLSVKHLDRITTELAAACWAREARILPVRGQAALVLVDIVRHDPLASRRAVTPPVLDDLAHHNGHAETTDDRPPWLPRPDELADPVHDPASASPGWVSNPPAAASVPAPRTSGASTSKKTPTDTGGQAEQPGVTGFGGVDVTDYV